MKLLGINILKQPSPLFILGRAVFCGIRKYERMNSKISTKVYVSFDNYQKSLGVMFTRKNNTIIFGFGYCNYDFIE